MSLKMAQITGYRITKIPFESVDENGEVLKFELAIKHRRLTPQVGDELQMIIARISKEQQAFWQKKYPQAAGLKSVVPAVDGEATDNLTQESESAEELFLTKDLTAEEMPRNWVVEQLVYLVAETDLLAEDGETPLPPTRETFEMLETAVLRVMLDSIRETAVPKKSGSLTLADGMPQADG